MTLLENVYTTVHTFDDVVIARDTTCILVGGGHVQRIRQKADNFLILNDLGYSSGGADPRTEQSCMIV